MMEIRETHADRHYKVSKAPLNDCKEMIDFGLLINKDVNVENLKLFSFTCGGDCRLAGTDPRGGGGVVVGSRRPVILDYSPWE